MEALIKKINDLDFVNLDQNKINKLEEFYKILISENEVHNLTRITDHKEVWWKHFYDSLLICNHIDLENKKVCDVGTGPGIPGIILKIVFPSMELTLVESNAKKTNFLKKAIDHLKLDNVHIITDRAEVYSVEAKETQDVIVSRAMAALNVLLEVSVQALKVNGIFIAMKSQKLDEELKDLNNKESLIGLQFSKIQEISEEIIGIRRNIFYTKVKSTPNKYPRMYAQIKNRPLGN